MRKILAFALLLASFAPLAARAAEEQPAPAENKALTSKQVSTEMAEVWCAKMEQCTQDKSMSLKECQKILFKSFKTGFDRQPKERPIQLERAGFDQCKNNVAQGSCEALKGAKSLPGCEFISLLGQQ